MSALHMLKKECTACKWMGQTSYAYHGSIVCSYWLAMQNIMIVLMELP